MTLTKRNQKIHVDTVDNTIASLKELEPLPKLELTLRETIAKMEVHLRGAINKGYSYEDLSGILAEQNILISAATLKQYLKELDNGSKPRRRKKSNLKKGNVSQKDLKLVSDDSDSSSNGNSTTALLANKNSSLNERNEVVGVSEKEAVTLNSGIKADTSDSEKKLVDNQINNNRVDYSKTLAERLKDPNYKPLYTDEDYKDDFNDY